MVVVINDCILEVHDYADFLRGLEFLRESNQIEINKSNQLYRLCIKENST